ncbi:MAG: LpxI family protein [Gammaproteobacteria bacterium]|nr:MAG: LpxI family protein [Gammaproteobacteria bacterium]
MEKKLLILSGRGKLPLLFKTLAEKKGYKAYSVGVKTVTDTKTDFTIPFLGFTELEELLLELGKPKIVMLGKFNPKIPLAVAEGFWGKLKVFLFGGKHKRNLEIFRSLKEEIKVFLPEEIVKVFIRYMESRGFSFLPSEEIRNIASPILATEGNLTPSVDLKSENLNEGKKFFNYAKRLANMDIGQTLVFKNGHIVAVESLEGTDQTIKRAMKLVGKGISVVKVARTNQDFRIDVPAVGLQTLKLLKKAKAKALFLEAGKVFMVEKEKFLREAEKSGIAVIGLAPR